MRVHVDRRMVRTETERIWATCYECGEVAVEALVELGNELEEHARVCLPCLKRAVAEAEAAIAKDKA